MGPGPETKKYLPGKRSTMEGSMFLILAGGLLVIIAAVVVISAVTSVVSAVAGEVEDSED